MYPCPEGHHTPMTTANLVDVYASKLKNWLDDLLVISGEIVFIDALHGFRCGHAIVSVLVIPP